jgi:hypothetical protein
MGSQLKKAKNFTLKSFLSKKELLAKINLSLKHIFVGAG